MARIPASKDHGCAWVTGASSGIGAALVRELAGRGWTVAASARSPDPLIELERAFPGRVMAVPCDVSDRESVQEAAARIRERFGPIGLLVSNAGVYLPFEGPAFSAESFERTVRVNLLGAAYLCETVIADFCSRRQGHIHLVSSATGFGGMPTASAYGATKAALINMAECLRIELDRHGVGVTLSTPGFVDTPAQYDNAFPKPFMISARLAARRIADAVERGGFETSFPRRFTWLLKAIYALPKFIYLPLVRMQTGWNAPPPLVQNRLEKKEVPSRDG
jgi:NAD(P)-dependent dehydrogenase (short-subunit alcohol dehydrogenase family)